MNIDFQPISSTEHVEDLLGIAELTALFQGECYVGDLEWDEDALLESFVTSIDDPVFKADYVSERAAGIQAAKDQVVGTLIELINERHGHLGEDSPFTWDFSEELLLRRKESLSPVGWAYTWLSLFWLIKSHNEYLVVTPDPKAFFAAFDDVFEAACAFILAGRSESSAWLLGDSRSARELLTRLGQIQRLCGTGAVKVWGDLTHSQKHSNDGGIDVLAVTTRNGAIAPDSEIYLLGATIQKANRLNKIVGHDQKDRIRNYFLQHPNPPMTGVMAIPLERNYLDEEKCAEKNCLYLPKDAILPFLGRHSKIYGRRPLRYAARAILRKSRQMASTVTFRA